MKDLSVTYLIDDDDVKRLEELAAAYTKQSGKEWTIESVFNAIMASGSKWDINDKLSIAEWRAGLISYEQMKKQQDAWKKARQKND